jgi:hypothetical protein
MRAAWFRGRYAAGERPPESAAGQPANADASGRDAEGPNPAPPAPPSPNASGTPPVPPVRPVHGHPTF